MKMQAQLFKYFTLLFISIAFINKTFATGEDPEVEKRKTYSKAYTLSAAQAVKIKNSFGTVKLSTVTGNEVKVDVTIIVRSSTDAKAQEMLDNINITDKSSGNLVSFETKNEAGDNGNGGRKGKKGNGDQQNMEINYVVYMPDANRLEVLNEFGTTTIDDRTGVTLLTAKFGDLNVGNLARSEAVNVEFGSLNGGQITGGNLSVKYSSAKVKALAGAMKCNFEFGDAKVGFTNALTDVSINNSYSDVTITVPNSFNGTYDIYTNFGDFSNSTGFKIKAVDDDNESSIKFDKSWAGVSGNGSVKVKIKSNFGKVSLKL